ncbi:hypothetical protein [Haloglycomyces albus]|uniref:hypothetical protein n=1 Tax=Haloglycomyces albus TaxID=526067 RepID=UPI000A05E91A|nr:hypothetical protein [Haloglycomyces albus]
MTRLWDWVGNRCRSGAMWVWEPWRFVERMELLRRCFPQWTFLYAQKANRSFVDVAARVADGVECASAGEVKRALAVGVRRIAVAGPVMTREFLAWLSGCAVEVTVHVESLQQLRLLGSVDWSRPVALRVNASVASELPATHHMTGLVPFGIEPERIPLAVEMAHAVGLEVMGFSHHAVSNCLDAEAYAEHVARSVGLSWELARLGGIELRYINVGGGLGSDPRGECIDVVRLAGLVPSLPAGVELVCEPGRFLAAPAGHYVCEVVDVKSAGGLTFVLVKGGTHHFRLPAAWGYGHPFTVVPDGWWPYEWDRPEVVDREVRVCGELCTPRDVLHPGQYVSRLRVGDRLVFSHAGAYGRDISHSQFLSHEKAGTVTLDTWR